MKSEFDESNLWVRREYGKYENAGIHDYHFVVLTPVDTDKSEVKILVLDGADAGDIMSLREFERTREGALIEFASYSSLSAARVKHLRF